MKTWSLRAIMQSIVENHYRISQFISLRMRSVNSYSLCHANILQFWNNQTLRRPVQDENVRTLKNEDNWRFPFDQKFRKFPGKISNKSRSEPFNWKFQKFREKSHETKLPAKKISNKSGRPCKVVLSTENSETSSFHHWKLSEIQTGILTSYWKERT